MAKNPRLQVPEHIDFLVRAIAPLKNSGKDWTLKEIAEEAFTDWLNRPENTEILKDYNLLKALKSKGLEAPNIKG